MSTINNTHNAAGEKASFNPAIQGLRGLAALFVYLFHVYDMPRKLGLLPDDISPILKTAILSLQSGVDLFFMISGFLITGSLIRHANARAFLVDRIIRIYPVFFFLHVFLFALAPVIKYKWMTDISPLSWLLNFFSNLLFLPGVFDLPLMQLNAWSLSYEWAFYLFSTLVYILWGRKPMVAKIFLVTAMPLLIGIYPRALFFVVGSGVFFLTRGTSRQSPWLKAGPAAALLFLAIMGCAFNADQPYLVWGAAPFGFLMFYGITSRNGLLAAFLETRALRFFGTISYSFYLWHAVVTFPLKHLLATTLIGGLGLPAGLAVAIFGITGFIISVLVSVVSYHVLEQRGGKLLKKLLKPSPALA